MKKILLFLLTVFAVFTFTACVPEETIKVGEGSWASNAFHDQVAKLIIEEGYGVDVNVVPADTSVMVTALKTNDVNLTMELWSDNVPTYKDDIAAGEYVKASTNFDDNLQGIYIPAYLQEEYPGLQTVEDLKDYAHLFPNPEGGDKGIIYGGPTGWSATAFLNNKIPAYGLDEFYTFKTADSTAALNSTLASAYASEDPWVGYNWEPTWAMGLYDMVLLEDTPYNEADFAEGIGAFPTVDVNVVVDSEFEENYPEIFEFLTHYETTSDITSSALAYMEENDLKAEDAAVWFLQNNEDIWAEWVTDDAYDNIIDAINSK
ncbi:MAG: ABC transporter substrate-binding protein [Candidatus Izimaplasma sp.]|nr:ABC transporter substrate-binding protein [Candidatus Izimaplasma bacterium]